MISIINPSFESFGDAPTEVTLTRPATPKQISEKLSKKPFQIIADLMEFNCFASIQTELSEQIIGALGEKYGVTFRFAQQA